MTTIAEAVPSRAGALRAGDDEQPHSLGLLGVAGLLWLALAAWIGGWFSPRLARLGRFAPWLVVLALWLAAWEAATAKLDLLPLPFFPSPQAFVEVYTDDWRRLGDSLLASLWLLVRGFAIGAVAGFAI